MEGSPIRRLPAASGSGGNCADSSGSAVAAPTVSAIAGNSGGDTIIGEAAAAGEGVGTAGGAVFDPAAPCASGSSGSGGGVSGPAVAASAVSAAAGSSGAGAASGEAGASAAAAAAMNPAAAK